MFRKAGLALSAMALCGLALAPSVALADGTAPSEKDETVYVYTNADGSVKNAEVSTVLKNPDQAAELSDSSTLTDIKGEDDKTFTGSGDSIVWKAEGENVTYKGATSAAAPISIRVSYTLDGQPVSAEEIAGKSGAVTIRYDFENHSATTASVRGIGQTVYTPFTCVTALMFDGDDFKNVHVENGKVINDGDDTIVAGIAMPGLKQSLGSMADDADVPDYFEVAADTTNFELKSTMTIVTAGLMSDLDADSLGISGVDGASALTDAMGQLIDGSDKLASGLEELASSSKQLEAGASTLLGGSQALEGGLHALAGDEGLGKLQAGASALEKNIGEAGDAVAAAQKELEEAAASFAGAEALGGELQSAMETLNSLKKENKIDESEYQTLSKALADSATTASSLGDLAKKVEDFKASLATLKEGLVLAKGGAHDLAAGVGTAIDKTGELAAGAGKLEYGAEQLNIAMPELTKAMQQAADGSKTLTQGMRTFNDEGVSRLVDTLENDFGGTLDRMNALSDAAKAYDNFAGITPGTKGSVKFVFETDAVKKQ